MELQNFASLLSGEATTVRLLTGLREFWAQNKDFWFSHAPLSGWLSHEELYKPTKDTHISLLLQYDQIFRHPCPLIRESDKPLAFRFATALALRMIHNGDYETCETWEKVFVLLCLRHNASLSLKQLAITKTLALLENGSDSLLLRFLNASIWATHEWKEKTVGYPRDLGHIPDSPPAHLIEPAIPVPTDLSVSTIENTLYESYKSLFREHSEPRIAVSISGGVDSMVAAHIAAHVCKELGKELVLLHINYGNRDCCEDECALIRWYANRLGAPLYIREITEMKRCRTTDLRTLYEDITRRIRFSFYAWFKCPVVLGHNQDDCYENAFRNLAKQVHFENLFGMTAVGAEQGVVTLRPMLRVPKREIRAFADAKGIPHLVDSTPAWSQRGQMRDRLLPAIAGFDSHILTGLTAFVERSQFLETQWLSAFQTWIAGLVVQDKRLCLPRDVFLESNRVSLNFWIQLWQKMALPARPSNKSFRNFMEALDRSRDGRCDMNAKCMAYISRECIVFVWN